MKWRAWLALTVAVVCAALAGALSTRAHAAEPVPDDTARHVVIVGISGLTWDDVSQSATGELWRLATAGSVGSLVDYAQQPLACPADGWLTLNAAARAQGPRPCASLPAVTTAASGATVAAMPQLIRDNEQYLESPDWGLLGRLASCATAVGPGAALALAAPDGAVSRYLPSAAELSPSVLARCPLTVIDLGQEQSSERSGGSVTDRQLAQLAAELPSGALLMVTAPGAAVGADSPHLMSVIVTGPGYAHGLLDSTSTRQPGIVALTDLTPTVARWLGRQVPAGTVGASITTADRGDLDSTLTALRGRDAAEQVWLSTHGWFFLGYAVAAALAFGLPALLLRGSDERCRRWRARAWRVAGVLAAAVPLGSYLANVAPWWRLAHPALWLYGLTAAWTLVVAAAALAGTWRRDALGTFGVVCAATLAFLAVDVIAGSRLQLDAPFGLCLLVSGRYYGIGNDALGIYCVSALVAAAWLAGFRRERPRAVRRRAPRTGQYGGSSPQGTGAGRAPDTMTGFAIGRAACVGLLAVVAAGWPGFGAKVGGTIALVPCLLLLLAWFAGVRVGGRWTVPVAVSGLAVFLGFAVISYFLPGAGVSDMGAFAGDLLHGRAGEVLARKVNSNVGSLTLNAFGWLIPVAALASGAALWRPAALRLRTLAAAFALLPLLRPLFWLCWLVLVIGWFADDSGVIVPAVALPFVVPLTAAMAASVSR